MIDAARFDVLGSIGAGRRGVTRLAWTPGLAEAEAWFRAEAGDAGLTCERDPAGNLWACPAAPPPWWAVGSHLDTVREGGRFDGALGVAAGFAVARRTPAPVAVISFADEEGARFNTPTFGSRALVGRLDVPALLARRDADGVTLEDALRGFGVDPGGIAGAPEWLPRLRGFLELHIDQSRAVAELGVPVAPVSRLATRTRLRADVEGAADHAGTTPMDERRDALAAAARLIVAATEPADDGVVATATRIVASPNALSTIPAEVAVWLDGRAPQPAAVDAWVAGVEARAAALERVDARVTVESRSDGVEFDAAVRAALGAASGGAPELVCFAGHDAGVLGERVPSGMLLVRNKRGVSHAPDEGVDLADAAAGVDALVRAVEALA
ncbi:MAG TPA: hydantoinase/carbamoylase family amidase [Solirubrobacteraceae bacterium]|nr:hydantoinase/carbamoylase family amidase [Solirubrobacteraceae bacterium]